MIASVLSFSSGEPFGVVVIDKPDPTMYDQRDAIKLWLETHLSAVDIDFVWGKGEVCYTAGGKAPYRASLFYSRSLSMVVLS